MQFKNITEQVGKVTQSAVNRITDTCDLAYDMMMASGNLAEAEIKYTKAKQGIEYSYEEGEIATFDPDSEYGQGFIKRAEHRLEKAQAGKERSDNAWKKLSDYFIDNPEGINNKNNNDGLSM